MISTRTSSPPRPHSLKESIHTDLVELRACAQGFEGIERFGGPNRHERSLVDLKRVLLEEHAVSFVSKLAGSFGEWWDAYKAFVDRAYEDGLIANNGVFVDLVAQLPRQSKKVETRPRVCLEYCEVCRVCVRSRWCSFLLSGADRACACV